MLIEKFDMETPLSRLGERSQGVYDIDLLWRQIGDTRTEFIQEDPDALRSLMSGLDYYIARHEATRRIVGAVSVMDCQRGLQKIDSLAVHPDVQRHGYGRLLAVQAISHCVERDASTIYALATPESQRLFTSLGFEVHKTHTSGNADMFLDIDTAYTVAAG